MSVPLKERHGKSMERTSVFSSSEQGLCLDIMSSYLLESEDEGNTEMAKRTDGEPGASMAQVGTAQSPLESRSFHCRGHVVL